MISVTDSSGAALATNTYDEYGRPGALNARRFQYTGQAWISELGLYYYKARFYSPELKRFLQPDPIGYAGGMNLYGYVGGDPVNMSDPTCAIIRSGDQGKPEECGFDYCRGCRIPGPTSWNDGEGREEVTVAGTRKRPSAFWMTVATIDEVANIVFNEMNAVRGNRDMLLFA